MGSNTDLELMKDIPGYRGILKSVLKSQIQLLIQQLSECTGEESVLLSANVSEGTFSHLGSESGRNFPADNTDVKRQFLGYCLRRHQQVKSQFMMPEPKSSYTRQQNIGPLRGNTNSSLSASARKAPYFPRKRGRPSILLKTKLQSPAKVHRQCKDDHGSNHALTQLRMKVESARAMKRRLSALNEAAVDSEKPPVSQNEESREDVVVKIEREDENDADIDIMENDIGSEKDAKDTPEQYEYIMPQLIDISKNDQPGSSKRKSQFPVRRSREVEQGSMNNIPGNQPVFPGSIEGIHSSWYEENSTGSPGSLSDTIQDRSLTSTEASTYGSDISDTTKHYMKTPQIDGLLVSRGEGRFEKLIRCDVCSKVCRTSNMARHKRRYCTGVPGLSPRCRGGVVARANLIQGQVNTTATSGQESESLIQNRNKQSLGSNGGGLTGDNKSKISESSLNEIKRDLNSKILGGDRDVENTGFTDVDSDDTDKIVIKVEPSSYDGEYGHTS